MKDPISTLLQAEPDWQIIELTPATWHEVAARETADLLICRHLSAHCPQMGQLLARWLPALKPGGWLAVVDTIVPGSRLRGKKANLQRRAAAYVNSFLRLQDGANGRNLSLEEWLELLQIANLRQVKQTTNQQQTELNSWLGPLSASPAHRARLRAMLMQAPAPVAAFLTPQSANDRITFFLTEIVLVGRLERSQAPIAHLDS